MNLNFMNNLYEYKNYLRYECVYLQIDVEKVSDLNTVLSHKPNSRIGFKYYVWLFTLQGMATIQLQYISHVLAYVHAADDNYLFWDFHKYRNGNFDLWIYFSNLCSDRDLSKPS